MGPEAQEGPVAAIAVAETQESVAPEVAVVGHGYGPREMGSCRPLRSPRPHTPPLPPPHPRRPLHPAHDEPDPDELPVEASMAGAWRAVAAQARGDRPRNHQTKAEVAALEERMVVL